MWLEGTTLFLEGILRALNIVLHVIQLPVQAYQTMTAKPTHKRKRVVIVGASFAGLWCQRNLCKDFDVTVVDYKRYFEYTPGILRVFVELGHLPRITAALPKMGSKFVCGEAVGIDSGRSLLQVKTKTGQDVQEIPFDYLLIGTGSSYSGSIKPSVREVTSSDRLATWTSEFERLRRAHSVLIVGNTNRELLHHVY